MIREKMTENKENRLNSLISKAVAALKPPENMTVSEWADKHRKLSPESSAEPGRWRTYRTPYLKEPMDAFTDPKVKRIVLVSSSQVGKSELENNIVGYIIDEDPGSILFIHPQVTDAREYSTLRIAPMIRDCKTLKEKVVTPKSRDSGNTIMQKKYPGGILTLCGSTEAHALASKPIRYIIGDERDRWAPSAGKEGDPWKLACARQITFYNSKAVEVSTPTIKNASAIESSFAEGTMERWCTRCPHCEEYNNINFEYIRYNHEEKIIASKKIYTVTSAWYICPSCGSILTEQEMKKQPSKWIAENPDAYKKGTRSFWLNAFVSPWSSWESIISEYLEALGDTRKLQVVYNTRFGELWEDRGDLEDEDSLLKRREDYGEREDGTPIELPEGVLVLTCGVDTQDDRLEYEVVGHGHFKETWGIKKGIIMGRPDDNETWETLDDVLDHVYKFKCGTGLKISMTFVDEGGHFTQDVRQQCNMRLSKKVFEIKGLSKADAPYIAPPKKQKILDKRKRHIGTCWQYQLGVSSGKQMIMDNLKVQQAGAKYCHFPKREDYGHDYFKGLLSERLTHDYKKKNPWSWEKIPGHERNEALDCRNYAMAAFKALPADLDAIEKRLIIAKKNRIEGKMGSSIQSSTLPSVHKKVKKRATRNKAVGKLEEW